MKTRLLTILMLITAGIFILNACKKNEEEDKVQLDANVSQFNTDANNYKSESDQADNDINNSLSSIPAFGRVAQGTEILSRTPGVLSAGEKACRGQCGVQDGRSDA